jgi:hypothetical protein
MMPESASVCSRRTLMCQRRELLRTTRAAAHDWQQCGARASSRRNENGHPYRSAHFCTELAPRPGLEPGTCGLTARREDKEISRNVNCLRRLRTFRHRSQSQCNTVARKSPLLHIRTHPI